MAYLDRTSDTGKRTSWVFAYRGRELSESTGRLVKYHAGREEYWSVESQKIEDEIRKSGISLTEHFVTGGSKFEARIDSALGQRLSECRQKCDSHRSLKEQYEAFHHEFDRTPERDFELQLGDIRFFGLVGDGTVRFGNEELEI